MKLARTLGLVLSAALVPALAQAQTAPDQPYDPNNPPPDQPQPQQAPPPAPAPAPAPVPQTNAPNTPVVVVNPTQPAPLPQPVEPEPGEEVYDSYNAPVFATGALVFAGSYGASAIVADTSTHPGADRLYVPLVGPWLALNDWGNCPIDQPRCDTNTTDKVLLVADGVFQAASVITMLDGLIAPSSHRVLTRTVDTKVHVTPTGHGIALFGHF
jgi:hypothetical protein